MSTQTPNLGLTKPAGNEKPQVSVINGNSDILDAAIGDVDVSTDGSLQGQVDALRASVSQKIAYTNNPNITDYNQLTENGIYAVMYGKNNAPENSWCAVLVARMDNSPNYVVQLAMSNNSNHIYYRRCTNGTWSSWATVI